MLLYKNPDKRLGSGTQGIKSIKEHAFFKSVDWNSVYSRKVEPVYVPSDSSQKKFRYFGYEALVKSGEEIRSVKSVSMDRDIVGRISEISGFSFTRPN